MHLVLLGWRKTSFQSQDCCCKPLMYLSCDLYNHSANHIMTSSNKVLKCQLRHALEAGGLGLQRELCYICQDLSCEKAAMAMHCAPCNQSVCERCVQLYHDVGFAMFLSREDRGSLLPYMEHHECATTQFLEYDHLEVYHLHEEYNDTPKFRKTLEMKIKKARAIVMELEDKLAASKLRAAQAAFNSTIDE